MRILDSENKNGYPYLLTPNCVTNKTEISYFINLRFYLIKPLEKKKRTLLHTTV